jgi:uncharacterized protein with NRDE domain
VCTLAIYFRTLGDFPWVVAANRDEHYDRPSAPPQLSRSRLKIVAGKDLRAGGTWLGVNEYGLVVGILNRHLNAANGAPTSDTRSRGLLCQDLLMRSSAAEANGFIEDHDVLYQPFTLLFADRREAYVAYNYGRRVLIQRLTPGLHVFSSAAEFDSCSAKTRRAYELFAQLQFPPEPFGADLGESVAALQTVLADHSLASGSEDPGDAICVHRNGSGTVSSSILFFSEPNSQVASLYCEGAPCRNCFGDALRLEIP